MKLVSADGKVTPVDFYFQSRPRDKSLIQITTTPPQTMTILPTNWWPTMPVWTNTSRTCAGIKNDMADEDPGTKDNCDSLAIPYELRVGITGHRQLKNPDGVRRGLEDALRHVVTVLAEASRDPHGAHGTRRSWTNRIDQALARLLSLTSRVLCPLVNSAFRLLRMPRRWHWPVVPVSSLAKPAVEQQTPIHITGISCLAAGSDQIFVEVVHSAAARTEGSGVPSAEKSNRIVEAVLPFQQEAYEKNFLESEELSAFRQSVALSAEQGGRSPTVIFPNFPLNAHGETVTKPDAYRAASQHVVESCEILIAVWDPDREEKPGGTGETARFAVSRNQTVIWIHPGQLKAGPRILQSASDEVCTSSSGQIKAPAGLVAVPMPTRARDFSQNFHQLAAYNRDSSLNATHLQSAIETEVGAFEAAATGHIPVDVVSRITSRILPQMLRADLLALHYQSLREAAKQIWPTMTAFAVTLMAFQIMFLPNWYPLAWGEFAVLVVCALTFRISLHEAWHDKWRNNRRLAEGLRTAMYSSIVPADEVPSSNHLVKGRVQNPLPFYHSGQSWMVLAIERLSAPPLNHEARIDWPKDILSVANFLADEWILPQAKYHSQAAHGHHKHASRFLRQRRCIIGAIVVVSLLHAFGVGHAHETHDLSAFLRFDVWVSFATVALPAWAAALHALSSIEDHERLGDRSFAMVPLLTDLAERLKQATSLRELHDLVEQSESLLLLETQEWSESLTDRKPEFAG